MKASVPPDLPDVSDANTRSAGGMAFPAVAAVLLVTMLELANYINLVVPAILPRTIYLPMMIIVVLVVASSSQLALYRLRLPLIAFVAVLVLINIMHGLFYEFGSGGEEAQGEPWTRIQYLLLGLGIATATTALSRDQLARIFAVCGFAIAGLVVFDLLFPEVLYSWTSPGVIPGRAAGTFLNANKPAEAMVLCALLAMPVLGPRVALALLMAMGLAIFATFSRAGMVAWVLLVAVFWQQRVITRTQVTVVGLLIIALAAGGGLLTLLVESQDLPVSTVTDITSRFSFLSTGDLGDDSAQSRGFVLREGIALFERFPLTGAGAGTTHHWEHEVAPHNLLVQMSAEYGIAGSLAWLALLTLVATGGYFERRDCQLAAALFLVLFSMSTHNVLDFPYWLVGLFLLSMNFGPPDLRRSMIMAGGGMSRRPG